MEEFDWAMNPDNLESAAFIDKDTIDLDRAVRIPHALHPLIVEAGLPKWIHHSGRKIARVEITTGTGDAIVHITEDTQTEETTCSTLVLC